MHNFDYKERPRELLIPEIVNMLTTLHECKGKQELYIESKPDILTALLEVAKIQSTKASNRIEGIFTSDERLEAIVKEKSAPRNRSEEEIAGYREVLATIHESYEYITARPNNILQLHRDLYTFSHSAVGGKYKNSDNIIAETDEQGNKTVRFAPVPAFQTAEAMEHLCNSFNDAIQEGLYDPLLLIPMFVLDFLCIHPFNDGNGRMSRLLTLLLLYRSGYIVGKYISIEMQIERSKETYYEVLQDSSHSWHESENNYLLFLRYYLGVTIKAYREFQDRVEHLQYRNLSKAERIKAVFDKRMGKITKAEILSLCPDISQTTVERTLNELLKSGYITKTGQGKSTGYLKNEREDR
ncbi:cell division protein Fic [Bacteroidia bacterium]|nr:cell division protein Fic [Bacteroidia bacterium]